MIKTSYYTMIPIKLSLNYFFAEYFCIVSFKKRKHARTWWIKKLCKYEGDEGNKSHMSIVEGRIEQEIQESSSFILDSNAPTILCD